MHRNERSNVYLKYEDVEAWILCDLFEAMKQISNSINTTQNSLSGGCVTTETLSLCLTIIHTFTTMYALSRIS